MLAFAPQAWTSDDTDAVERLPDPVGDLAGLPVELDGCARRRPSRTTRRAGSRRSRRGPRWRSSASFGYELDPTALAADDRRAIADQVAFYKANRELFQRGRFVRLRSPFEDGGNQTAWMVVAPDGRGRSSATTRSSTGRSRPPTACAFAASIRRRSTASRAGRTSTTRSSAPTPATAGGDELMGVGPVARCRSPRGRRVGRLPGLAVRARGRLGPARHRRCLTVSWCVRSPVYGPDRSTPDRSGPYSTDATVHMRPARRRCPKSICMRLGDGP